MMETVETLAKRLNQLERTVEKVTLQLSFLIDELAPNAPEYYKTGTDVPASNIANKKEATRIINELLERMGIADVDPIPTEEVRKSMASRIRAEDNEFSRAIIEEREK